MKGKREELGRIGRKRKNSDIEYLGRKAKKKRSLGIGKVFEDWFERFDRR